MGHTTCCGWLRATNGRWRSGPSTGYINPWSCPSAYLDDILIYTATLEEHQEHVWRVLEALSKVGLHLKPEKCHFHKTEVKYLGLIIFADGVRMDPEKVMAILQWGSLRNLHDVYVFLGFANFYWRFILGYSNVVVPLGG